jgi:uncharacterized membrane protein
VTRRVTIQTATAAIAVTILVGAPLIGWPPLIRLPAVLAPALGIALLAARPWRWTGREREAIAAWAPSTKTLWLATLVTGALLAWIVVTRFQSGDINAVDFTVYFDRPLYQTAHGRLLFVETADVPAFSYRSQFAVHAHYILLALAPLYRFAATPYWLLVLSVVAVLLGALHVFRIVRHLSGSGMVAAATAFAFVLNANTARALLFGFHPEILYLWFVPWTLDAALHQRRWWFVTGVLACASVKEDACMPLFAVSLTLALTGRVPARSRWLYLAAPTAIGLVNLAFYYCCILSTFGASSTPSYAAFWVNYGPTPARALWGIATHPVRAASAVASSGLPRILLPHALLPPVAWRWTSGILPIVALYAVSANSQLRAFGLYYSVIFLPFLVIGATVGALTIARALFAHDSSARLAAAVVVFLAALLVYGDRAGYSLRPWRPEVAATPQVISSLSSEPVVLVQSALHAHAGYDPRVVLLTRETLADAKYRGVAIVLAPRLNAYPFSRGELDWLIGRPPVISTPGGVLVVRRP